MRILIGGLILLCAGPALARGSAEVTTRQLIDNPKRYDSKLIVVRRIRCVDPGATGFVCEATAADRRLRFDGSVLGSITEPAIAEKMSGLCKGVAALANPACTFDAVLTPTGCEIESGVTTIRAQEIDLVKPRRP